MTVLLQLQPVSSQPVESIKQILHLAHNHHHCGRHLRRSRLYNLPTLAQVVSFTSTFASTPLMLGWLGYFSLSTL